jgi:sulfur carrier protein ThiS
MRVTVTANGVTGLPASQDVELSEGSTIVTLVRAISPRRAGGQVRLSADPEMPTNWIVTLKGNFIPVSRYDTQVLSEGDAVTIIPLVVGG